MKKAIPIAIVLLFLSVDHILKGQDLSIREMRFEKIKSKELSSFKVTLQGSQGFLWAHANAKVLLRFDGLEVVAFDKVKGQDSPLRGNISALMEDGHGRIWVGTTDGLYQFDRASQHFVEYLRDTTQLRSFEVLREDQTGHLWFLNREPEIDTGYVLGRISLLETSQYLQAPHAMNFESWPMMYVGNKDTLPEEDVLIEGWKGFSIDDNDHLWISSLWGLTQFVPDSNKFTLYQSEPDRHYNVKNYLRGHVIDQAGRIWVESAKGGLQYFSREQKKFFPVFSRPSSANPALKQTISSMSLVPPNQLWFAMGEFLHNANLYSLDLRDFSVNRLVMAPIFGNSQVIDNGISLDLVDHTRNLWFGSRGIIYSQANNQFEFLPARQRAVDRIKGEGVVSVFRTKDGIIWLGSAKGILNRWDPATNHFRHYDLNDLAPTDVPSGNITGIAEDKLGRLWLGTWNNGLYIMDRAGETFRHFPYLVTDTILKSRSTIFLGTDNKGDLFVGAHMRGRAEPGGLYKLDYQTNRFHYFPDRTEARKAWSKYFSQYADEGHSEPWALSTRDMVEDEQGNYWVSHFLGLSYIDGATGEVKEHLYLDALPHGLHLDARQNIWMTGLRSRFWKYHIPTKSLTSFSDLPEISGNSIRTLAPAPNGDLWLHSKQGMVKFDPETESVIRFYPFQTWMPDNWPWPSGLARKATLPDNSLLIPCPSGLLVFHPDSIRNDTLPPSLVITDFLIDNNPTTFGPDRPLEQHISLTESIRLPYHQNNLAVKFTAIHLKDPAKNRVEYRMLPLSDQWIDAGQDRIARFLKTPPGHYTFQVRAANSDGYWTENLKELAIVILPPWWQTWWAKVLYVLAAIGTVFGYIHWRTAALRKRQEILEQTVTERTAEVVAEKERSDELLLNILPAETAEELKQYGAAKAKNYDTVTVLFTDFKDFTKVAEKLTPQELVAEIHYCYEVFDRIMEKHNVEKIKTIGDAYMAAAGLPTPSTDNPADAVRAALAIRDFMAAYQVERAAQGRLPFEIRIGVHTGPVVAGIVGIKKFAYDIWGDTVNTAARMESSGEPGRVNISHTTYQLLRHREEFSFVARGKIQAKNKGEIEMYFVN